MENTTTNGPLRRAGLFAPTVETAGKKVTISGYAALFDSVYSMGWFTESIDRNAFKNADLSDVRILLNHNPDRIHGRTKSRTAAVGTDSRGLWYTCTLPKSADAEALAEGIGRGDIDASSWGFSLAISATSNGDQWEKRGGKDHRIITDVRIVYDCSPVTFPANPATSVYLDSAEAKRSRDAYYSTHTATPSPGLLGASTADVDTQILLLQSLQERELFKTKSTITVNHSQRVAGHLVEAEAKRVLAKYEAYINQPIRY